MYHEDAVKNLTIVSIFSCWNNGLEKLNVCVMCPLILSCKEQA
jgi:hypothetical protein